VTEQLAIQIVEGGPPQMHFTSRIMELAMLS